MSDLHPIFQAALAPFIAPAPAAPTEAALERLSTALDAYNRADLGDDGSFASAKACIRAQNVLVDACIDCGMPLDGDEFIFAPKTVARWLASA